MNAMKNRTAYYRSALQSMKWKMIFAGYLNFYYCERYDDPYVF